MNKNTIKSRKKWRKRQDRMKELLDKGYTLKRVGAMFGVSKQRVFQIISKEPIEITNSERLEQLEAK